MITPKDKNVEDRLLKLMSVIDDAKPNDKSDKDRYYAIITTDIEKIYAYFQTYIMEH